VCTGLLVAFLYNKTKNVQLPTALGFFSGVRFVPIVTILALAGLGMIFAMI
jgi:PTS system N-acetylglucosamine-specific IIC component